MTQAGHSETRQSADGLLQARAVNSAAHIWVVANTGDGVEHESVAQTLKRERQLNLLTQLLHSAHDIESIMPEVMRLVVVLVGADAGALPLITPDGEKLEFRYTFGVPEALQGLRLPRCSSLAW